jgi:hypothetical protein
MHFYQICSTPILFTKPKLSANIKIPKAVFYHTLSGCGKEKITTLEKKLPIFNYPFSTMQSSNSDLQQKIQQKGILPH